MLIVLSLTLFGCGYANNDTAASVSASSSNIDSSSTPADTSSNTAAVSATDQAALRVVEDDLLHKFDVPADAQRVSPLSV
ncbi:guanyl-specific ribonuclease Sa [Paenibacillus sacheonensis]|nr:guanyl-specific ribonuclease Sa [Paenibacillus sacheonensis]